MKNSPGITTPTSFGERGGGGGKNYDVNVDGIEQRGWWCCDHFIACTSNLIMFSKIAFEKAERIGIE